MQSSQDFVRALKATGTASTSKIDIAWGAWNDKSFYVPNKEDIIAEWILTTFTKEKSKSPAESSILDKQYWELFGSLLKGRDVQGTTESHTLKWIKPLLLRFSLSSIFLAFYATFQSVLDIEKEPLFYAFTDVITSIWSIASQKMTTESIQECLGCWISNQPDNSVYGCNKQLGRLIATSYRNSLNNSSNKKKLCSSFLHIHLIPWLNYVSSHLTSTDTDDLAIIDAGIDTIFNLDILRQNLDSTNENALMSQLFLITEDHPQIVLKTLAFIFRNYIGGIKKYRGALFSQGSQQISGATLEEFREAGMRFFKSCVTLLDGIEKLAPVWSTKVLLLETVDKENLFSHRQQDARITLNSLQENAISGLSVVPCAVESASAIVECLTTIAKIDYDLVIPFLPRILPRLLWVTSSSPVNFTFLEELLNYHTKTRTMSTLIESLFASFKVQDTHATSVEHAYQTQLSSPVVHTTFLTRLSKAIQTFMTESQAAPIVNYITSFLMEEWTRCTEASGQQLTDKKDTEESRPKKKQRKSDVTPMEVDQDSSLTLTSTSGSTAILTFCLGARLSSVVLTSLPLRSLSAPVLEEVNMLNEELRDGFLAQTVLKAVKGVKKNASWNAEVALASFLRVLYSLDTASGKARSQEKLYKKLMEIAGEEESLPELSLEVFRYLLYGTAVSQHDYSESVVDLVLNYLEKHFPSSSVSWTGEAHRLGRGESGKAEGALAILHMVVERWLPVIDHHSSKEQLERFIKIILRITPPTSQSCSSAQEMQPEHLLLQLLTAAEFWELHNIRAVFLDLLDRETSASESTKDSKRIVALFYLILYFPMEYFTWQLLHDLVKRAWGMDQALSKGVLASSSSTTTVTTTKKSTKNDPLRPLTIFRTFLRRAVAYSGHIPHETSEEIADALVHLLREPVGVSWVDGGYGKATVELVEAYVSRLLKTTTKGGSEPFKRVLQQFPPTLFDHPDSVRTRSFSKVVQVLTEEASDTKLPTDFIIQLRTLEEQLSQSLLPKLEAGGENVELIEGWQGLLKLNTWLNAQEGKSQHIAPVGARLASSLISGDVGSVKDQAFLSTLAVILQELGYKPETERAQHLEAVLACYVAFSDIISSESQKGLDEELGKTTRKLDISDYVHLLDVVLESMSASQCSSATLTHVVHLATVLLREHPSHALVHIQKFVFGCLSDFSGHDVFVNASSQLRLEVLDLVSSYCINQQGALRPIDISSVWLLLSKFLAPSHMHDPTTDTQVFHKITTIVSSLIRFRRDLVTQTLPHLGMILRQLILSTRACRPNLGAKQTKLIMNTQPRWISSTQPLQASDVKALSRLLESLNNKTTVRSLSSTTSAATTQKAESLSKPFSKHAPFVLRAYVEVMNDPFCALGLEVRKVLEPGLFVLCGMVNEHSRDALMVSGLDGGGKLILKALWKEYEKQKYVGKG